MQKFLRIALFAIILAIGKLLLLPLAQAVDPDAVSRVFISIQWLEDPHWIKNGNWVPFHFYLNGFILSIWNNRIYAPALLNIILSSLMLFPFFFLVRREFNEKGAFIVTVLLAFCPFIFRNSFLALSEIPYLFLIITSLNFLSKGYRSNALQYIVFAGLIMTIACGFRYESWFLILILVILLFIAKEYNKAIIFCLISSLFPCIWIIQSFLSTGSSISSFQWAFNAITSDEHIGFENFLRRIWFYPFSWMIGLGPLSAFYTLKIIIHSYKLKQRNLIINSIPFITIFTIFLINAILGSLLLQHRFSSTLVVLSLPFLALYFKDLDKKKIKQAWVFGITMVGLSFVYNTSGAKPLPRLKDQSPVQVSEIIRHNTNSNSVLLMDFWGWETTYYTALHSGLSPNNIVMSDASNNSEYLIQKFNALRQSRDWIILLSKTESRVIKNYELKKDALILKENNSCFEGEVIFENDKVILFKKIPQKL